MFVITADQVDSRSRADIVGETLAPAQRASTADRLAPPRRPQRRRRAPGAHRRRRYGARDRPRTHPRRRMERRTRNRLRARCPCRPRPGKPAATRSSPHAKPSAAPRKRRRGSRSTSRRADTAGRERAWPSADDAEALVNLALVIRERRTPPAGSCTTSSPPVSPRPMRPRGSASPRRRPAPAPALQRVRPELAALPALTRLLENVDRANTRTDPAE